MFGSQALDTLIGVALLMSIVSLAASTIVEAIATVTNKRGKDLKDAIDRVLGEVAPARAADGTELSGIGDTVAIESLRASNAGRGRQPSYIPREAFADGVTELIQAGSIPTRVQRLLTIVVKEGDHDLAAMRTALDRYYDAAMARVTGLYKRWSMVWLFALGLTIAVAGNVSVPHVAESLWNDTTTREAVVAAAGGVSDEGLDASELESVSATVEGLTGVGLPVGWNEQAKATWGPSPSWQRAGIVVGWLTTALLTMLGAQFWFDLLKRFVSLRGSGGQPDETSPAGPDTTPSGGLDPNAQLRAVGAMGAPDDSSPEAPEETAEPVEVIKTAFGAPT